MHPVASVPSARACTQTRPRRTKTFQRTRDEASASTRSMIVKSSRASPLSGRPAPPFRVTLQEWPAGVPRLRTVASCTCLGGDQYRPGRPSMSTVNVTSACACTPPRIAALRPLGAQSCQALSSAYMPCTCAHCHAPFPGYTIVRGLSNPWRLLAYTFGCTMRWGGPEPEPVQREGNNQAHIHG